MTIYGDESGGLNAGAMSALLAAGLSADDTRKVLGGNYARVFAASVG